MADDSTLAHDEEHPSAQEEKPKLVLATEMPGEAPVEPQDGPQYVLPPPLTPDDAERLEKAHKCLTAFLVVVEPDGTAWATNDVNLDMVLTRPPTPSDMYKSCAEVMKDITMAETVNRTVQTMAQVMPAIQANVDEQKRQAKVAQKLMERGIHVPGR